MVIARKAHEAFTLEAFQKWLDTKDPDEQYEYCDGRQCLIAQFLRDTGVVARPSVGSVCYSDMDEAVDVEYLIPEWIVDIAVRADPRTFGAVREELDY